MIKNTQGIAQILNRLGAWRSGGNVNLLEFGSGPSAPSGVSSRGLLMLIVLTHAAMLGYVLGASLIFDFGDRESVQRTALNPEPRQVSLNKVDREASRAPVPAEPPASPPPVAVQYSELQALPEPLPTAPSPAQVANSIWPEDKAVRPQERAAPPEAEADAERRDPPADITAPTPPERNPPLHFTPNPARRPLIDFAARSGVAPLGEEDAPDHAAGTRGATLNPHPPERLLTPPVTAAPVEIAALPQPAPAAAADASEPAPRLLDNAAMRAERWPEDSGHIAHRHAALPETEPTPAPLEDAPLAEATPPAPPQPQPAPTAAERLALAQPMPERPDPMMEQGGRIGDPGIIIDRFVAIEEPVAPSVPLPERRGLLAGEVTTQELSASLGPDLTILSDSPRERLLRDYRGKIRAHLSGRKPPGGFGSDTVVVGFTLSRSGEVLAAQILESQGIYHLEQGTLNAVYEAAPFPKPPRELKGARFDVFIQFRFE